MVVKQPWVCHHCGYVINKDGFPNHMVFHEDVICPQCGGLVLSIIKWNWNEEKQWNNCVHAEGEPCLNLAKGTVWDSMASECVFCEKRKNTYTPSIFL
jgi:RNA polymerase subunit RPABC4/transcription elongation factor Spt4